MDENSLILEGGEHAVLMLHGVCGTHLELMLTANMLHRSGLSVVIPKIAGYTYGSPCTDYESWIVAASQTLQTMRERYRSVSLCGLSMGATLALALAEDDHDLHSLVLLSTTLFTDGWAMPWYRFLLGLVWYTPLRHRYKYRERAPYGIKNIELRARVQKALEQNAVSEIGGQDMSLEHLRQASRLCAHVLDNLERVTTDTLLIHAVDDETASPQNAERVYAEIGSEHKEIVYLGDCYHIITVDNERETVAYETERFIKEAVNRRTEGMAFDLPAIVSKELQRSVRRQGG